MLQAHRQMPGSWQINIPRLSHNKNGSGKRTQNKTPNPWADLATSYNLIKEDMLCLSTGVVATRKLAKDFSPASVHNLLATEMYQSVDTCSEQYLNLNFTFNTTGECKNMLSILILLQFFLNYIYLVVLFKFN